MATDPPFAAKLAEACKDKTTELRIHVTDLKYCNSAGLREFVRAVEVGTSGDTYLTIVGASRIVHQVIAVTGLGDRFGFEP